MVHSADDESNAYMDEPGNLQFVSQGAVLRCDDSIVNLLDAPVGSVFFRDTESGEFIQAIGEDDLVGNCVSCGIQLNDQNRAHLSS